MAIRRGLIIRNSISPDFKKVTCCTRSVCIVHDYRSHDARRMAVSRSVAYRALYSVVVVTVCSHCITVYGIHCVSCIQPVACAHTGPDLFMPTLGSPSSEGVSNLVGYF